MKSLNLAQAQKLALLSQGLPLASNKGSAKAKTLAVFEQLGYVQIDTISVVQRAHHHTCLLYTSPSPRDRTRSRMPSSA